MGVKRTRVRVQIEAVAQLREAPVCADKADQMEIQNGTARKSEGWPQIEDFGRALSECLARLRRISRSQHPLSSLKKICKRSSHRPPAASQDNSTKPAAAQDQQPATPAKPEEPPKKKKKPARGAFVVAPLPISSPAIGSGIVPVLGYIFPFSTKDKVSPPSTIGGAGTDYGQRQPRIRRRRAVLFQREYL